MKSTIFIPKLCKVGFNERSDTYTGMLGYIIYNDGKKWRKEDSWNSWIYKYITAEDFEKEKQIKYENLLRNILGTAVRVKSDMSRYKIVDNKFEYYLGHMHDLFAQSRYHYVDLESTRESLEKEIPYESFKPTISGHSTNEKIKPIEFENVPMEGFVLNRKAGGYKSGWDMRQTYCRVYDPRGFEFEITIPNLLYILEHSNSIKGKGLDGKFIYGWDGKDLVLIPENAPEFQEMMDYTKLQDGKVLKKDMVRGNIYINGRKQRLTYMGDAYEVRRWNQKISSKKKIWFHVDSEDISRNDYRFESYSDVKSIKYSTGEVNPNFANLVDKLEKNDSYYTLSKIDYTKLELTEDDLLRYFEHESSVFYCYARQGKIFVHISLHKVYNGYRYYGNNFEYKVTGLDKTYNYKSIYEILKNHELWQLKMTK